ncbi:MAG: PAS domain S-box protein [Chloroflexi bacterium]|nr:PAS domain S-box protein [Chloroflexota bacterium]
MIKVINRLIDVPTTDSGDARRRKLLNILLLGVGGLDLAMVILTLVALLLGSAGQAWEGVLLLASGLIMLAGVGIIFAINHYRSGALASALFLLLLIAVSAFADQPIEIASGRSTFIFAIPIIMASVLLLPYTSFIAAALVGIVASILAVSAEIVPNVPAILGFFVIALVSWLSARSLERALVELQAINRELDQRVADRTRDLAEALLRVQAESSKNQAILESIADGVIVFDNDDKVMVANPALSQYIDMPTEQIAGKDVETLMAERVTPADRATLVTLLKDQDAPRTGTRFQLGKKTFSVSVAAVRTNEGDRMGNVMVLRDFTREAELERMKSAFVSTASHELRTPLNAILGYSDMLKEAVYGPLSQPQTSTMDRIMANTKRMLNLVNNILDQAQIEAGQLRINPYNFSVKELLNDLESMMQVLAEQKGLQFITKVDDNVPDQLRSDAQRLHQILVNLVGNAVKFTQKGSVTVHVSSPDPEHWALKVIDTGAGMPEDALTYIFEAFRQVDGTVTRRHAGTGLGLAIVRQLANLLGGDVTVASKLGEGSTFTVLLPLVKAQEEPQGEELETM